DVMKYAPYHNDGYIRVPSILDYRRYTSILFFDHIIKELKHLINKKSRLKNDVKHPYPENTYESEALQ
ncbi:hypothetical protein MMJ09_19795, partial [Bacillus vallismortis]|nr:hypothetical protein [Bacillus vallismortis]